jgi:hypothetical protein
MAGTRYIRLSILFIIVLWLFVQFEGAKINKAAYFEEVGCLFGESSNYCSLLPRNQPKTYLTTLLFKTGAMTLGEFFEHCSNSPVFLLAFFILIPLIALLALFFSKGQGHQSSWKYLYSVLIYLVAIPGIFAVTLSIYLFLFERRSIMETNIYTQVLPVVSMLATFILIWKQVDLDLVPGFDKLSGLVAILTVLIILMWVLDKTHIFSVMIIPFYVVVLMLIVGFFVVRMALRRLTR